MKNLTDRKMVNKRAARAAHANVCAVLFQTATCSIWRRLKQTTVIFNLFYLFLYLF